MDILLKYHKLRKIDSNTKQSNAVEKKNLRNGTLKNPKDICPATESGGVILIINKESKKRFFI
jgi:hypothetical protein